MTFHSYQRLALVFVGLLVAPLVHESCAGWARSLLFRAGRFRPRTSCRCPLGRWLERSRQELMCVKQHSWSLGRKS